MYIKITQTCQIGMGRESKGRACQWFELQKDHPIWMVQKFRVDLSQSSNLMGVIVQSIDNPTFEFSFGSIPCSAFWITAVGTWDHRLTLTELQWFISRRWSPCFFFHAYLSNASTYNLNESNLNGSTKRDLNEGGNAREAGSKGGLNFLTTPSLSIDTA